ncbi:MAG: UvrD-helicase domain-containing protein [Candidatus Hydrogenedens sp.]|nr:UvrD-helicase domain-containing protein [Candidatus Hydrogenedentota bacterium]NLF57967.1 UvrD-helicase domain-containing protein [Candidatus Hydrogenedens sp.]
MEAPDGPVLVLAGAGSGKTRVIIERMAWLVEERGVDPRYLLALTFTNKAAAEMRGRLAARLGVERLSTFLGTFHSFGLYVLRREMDRLGRSKNFTIFDETDQLSLMKRLVKDLPSGNEPVSPRAALSWISRLKQNVDEPDWEKKAAYPAMESMRLLWKRYHEALKSASAVDFDDLLVLLVRLFTEDAEVRARYQRRYRHVLIDEYQDTNRAQYLIAKFLGEEHRNIFAVGDEDQSIYSWRGADINNILDFSRDFPNAMVHRLERNYRSTKAILDAANRVVKNNINRLGKSLWTDNTEGGKPRWRLLPDGETEARFIAEDIAARGIAPREAAILYRTNAQSRLIEEGLRRKNLNYVVVGGVRFYSRKEVKDILAYLRLLVNPRDDESLRRIINVPPRAIGGTTQERISEYAAARAMPLLDVLREIETDETLPARARQSALGLVTLLDDLAIEAKTGTVAGVAEKLLERVEYRDFVLQSDEKDSRSRIEVVDEFVVACREHDKTAGTPLADFLNDLALSSDVDGWDPDQPAVTLMTCHSAKGLEFDHVYLAGMEDGLFPLVRDEDSNADLEEERRLCYVAMTRARRTLTLTAAASRMIYGRTDGYREVSRFIDEIGMDLLEPEARPKAAARPKGPMAEPVSAASGGLRVGTRVRHAKFGSGTVMYVSGAGDKTKARVRFDTGKVAMLMISLAPLEILEGRQR